MISSAHHWTRLKIDFENEWIERGVFWGGELDGECPVQESFAHSGKFGENGTPASRCKGIVIRQLHVRRG
jgi:hypothetical protein